MFPDNEYKIGGRVQHDKAMSLYADNRSATKYVIRIEKSHYEKNTYHKHIICCIKEHLMKHVSRNVK